MNLLLDTHALLWWAEDNARLSAEMVNRIEDSTNCIYVSAATLWEIEIKRAKGKLEAPADPARWVRSRNLTELPITFEHAVTAGRLPPHHRDPFDRALIAQAQIESATLISDDSVFERYPVNVMRASAA